MRRLVIAAAVIATASGALAAETGTPPRKVPDYIGTARMLADGTIELNLRAEAEGIVGHSLLSYRPGDPDYAAIKSHVGPIAPGEVRAVRPWPDGE